MTRTFVSLRGIAALSVAVTLLAAPIASAQTSAPTSHTDVGAPPRLMNAVAFGRLAQPSENRGTDRHRGRITHGSTCRAWYLAACGFNTDCD